MFKAKIKSPRLLIAVYTKSLDAHTTSFVAFVWVDFNTFLSSRPTLKAHGETHDRQIRRGISNLTVTQCETSMEGFVITGYS